MKELTDRQSEVLEYISVFISEHSYPPTIREIGDKFAISVKGAYDHIKALEKKGFIRLVENRSRTIEVVNRKKDDEPAVPIPLIGTVAAGRPVFAEENYNGVVMVPQDMVWGGRHFALSVRGDSMKDAGILSGDVAVIEQKQTAENGEIVVALVDDSATLKRFYKEKQRIRLQAENPAYPPIYTQEVRILGKLKGIIRKYA
jgi:repressor LexA